MAPPLVDEYRWWLEHYPGMTAGMIRAVKARERTERRALLAYLRRAEAFASFADARTKRRPRLPALATVEREFKAHGEDRYVMGIPTLGITFEADRIRREHKEVSIGHRAEREAQ